ncbi:class I SAM-dependent methyltransferase [Streptomyces sp. NPDC006140]|uniref:class I SAM-dependent methyltransferase n=1 Tax=Streptomyces sp. NPDC006140 TaxID=3154579 RepID=UPI0034070536
MVSSKTTAVYDEHADRYNELMSPEAGGDYLRHVHATLRDLLGPGDGATCLDVCCGTGAHAATLTALGWSPVGADLSRNQLRHAARRLPVAVADATALPLATGSLPAAVCVLAGTDVPDYPAALREIARALAPSWNTTGVRARLGAWHIPLAELLNGATAADLSIERTAEAGREGVPELFGFTATLGREASPATPVT